MYNGILSKCAVQKQERSKYQMWNLHVHWFFLLFKLTTIAEFYKICSVVLCNPPTPNPFFFLNNYSLLVFLFLNLVPSCTWAPHWTRLGGSGSYMCQTPRLNVMFGGGGVKLRKPPSSSSEGCNIDREKERSCTYLLS